MVHLQVKIADEICEVIFEFIEECQLFLEFYLLIFQSAFFTGVDLGVVSLNFLPASFDTLRKIIKKLIDLVKSVYFVLI